jgi:hypothetical protein
LFRLALSYGDRRAQCAHSAVSWEGCVLRALQVRLVHSKRREPALKKEVARPAPTSIDEIGVTAMRFFARQF